MKSTYELPRLTRCPKCQTTFRVSNEQLRLAGGKVRCGHCDSVFNALFALVTEVPTIGEHAPARPSVNAAPTESDASLEILTEETDQTGLEPDSDLEPDRKTDFELDLIPETFEVKSSIDAEFESEAHHEIEDADVPGEPSETHVAEVAKFDETFNAEEKGDDADASRLGDAAEEIEYIELSAGDLRMESPFDDEEPKDLTADSEPAVVPEHKVAVDEESIETEDDDLPPLDTRAAEQPEYDESIENVVVVSDEDRQKLEETIPFAIRDSVLAAEKPGMSRRLLALLSVLALVLLGALAIQLAVFRGLQLGQQFPALRPFLDQVCHYVGCSYTGRRDVKQIHLLNRDIRGIPDRAGVLLITATMRNDAAYPQPFPDFEIVLSDLASNVVAQRRFPPAEYLGALGREQSLMQPHTPVQVQLEVLDPGADAVNFEINFY